MKLNNKELYQLLDDKEINFLYHANTVRTFKSFVEISGLMSRGAIEDIGLDQSPQDSDDIDKVFDVWYDIFLDTTDLHKYFSRQNLYGPVLMRFNNNLVLNLEYEFHVTKDNPINWTSAMTDKDKYFESVQELRDDWDKYQRQRKMFTIRMNKKPILFDHLKDVVIDDPGVQFPENGKDLVVFNEAKKILDECIDGNPIFRNKLKIRECTSCFCKTNYLHQVSVPDLKRLFLLG